MDRAAGAASRCIVIAGAGSIGCFVGGMLVDAGRRVVFLGRPRIIDELRGHGMRLTSFEGRDSRIVPARLELTEDPAILRQAALVLVCVKSADTAAMAAIIAAYAPRDAVIVSLQNGVANVGVLERAVGGLKVLAGMVPFNVVAMGRGRFHRAVSGEIVIGPEGEHVAAQLSTPGLMVRSRPDILGVQWGKLLVNLNNALNALSGLPLREQLSDRAWRTLLADQIAEALAVIAAAGIVPVSTTPLPPRWTPRILRLPDPLFRLIAGSMIRIDPQARSSMWEDLQLGRRTEIDFLQGAILDLAARHGRKAPFSERILALVKAAEGGTGSPRLSAAQVRGGA